VSVHLFGDVLGVAMGTFMIWGAFCIDGLGPRQRLVGGILGAAYLFVAGIDIRSLP
jgi:hypothetical protein